MRAAFITGYGGNSVVRVAGKVATTTWHDELAFAKDHYVVRTYPTTHNG
jgi:hypothetical protein